MRPILRPGLRLVGSTPDPVVLLDAEEIVALDPTDARLLESLDGLADEQALAARPDRPPHDADAWARLREAGLVVDVDAVLELTAELTAAQRTQVHGDLLALVADDPHHGARRWRQRRDATVRLLGPGATRERLVELLCHGGVGTVAMDDAEAARLERLRETYPGTRLLSDLDTIPDLVVLNADREPTPEQVGELMRGHVPHLLAGMRGRHAVIGPLVDPGATACLRCGDLARRDTHPTWPALRRQLSRPRTHPHPLGTTHATAIVMLAAALAGADVLNFLDGRSPATVNTSFIVSLDEPVPRPRAWEMRPDCGCGWPQDFT